MNCFAARARWTGSNWIGEFRAERHGEFRAVKVNGETALFPDKQAARLAAFEALVGYLNGNLVSSGMKAGKAKLEAERLFLKGGRVVAVERRA